jgi:hypothetical protein
MLLAGVAALALGMALGLSARAPAVEAGITTTLFIDANGSTGGDCNPANNTATVANPSTHTIQICLAGNTSGNAVDGTDIKILYDNTLNAGVGLGGSGVTCDGTVGTGCVNDNPNLNESALGTGWACDAFGTTQPIADTTDLTGGDTSLQCFTLGSTTLQNGLIATVTFNVIGNGTDIMSFSSATGVSIGGGVVDCAPATSDLNCVGATITKGTGGTPVPTNTPTNTNTPVATNTPVPPTATFTPSPTRTPTATATLCAGNVTCTPVPTSTAGRIKTATFTPSATVPATAVPSETEGPPPPPAATPTRPGGGTGPGGLIPPDTGTGSPGGGVGTGTWLAVAAALAIAGAGIAGSTWRWARQRRRA